VIIGGLKHHRIEGSGNLIGKQQKTKILPIPPPLVPELDNIILDVGRKYIRRNAIQPDDLQTRPAERATNRIAPLVVIGGVNHTINGTGCNTSSSIFPTQNLNNLESALFQDFIEMVPDITMAINRSYIHPNQLKEDNGIRSLIRNAYNAEQTLNDPDELERMYEACSNNLIRRIRVLNLRDLSNRRQEPESVQRR
jgi:hypothetical protein